MKGKRKQHTPEFTCKVVLESLQRDTTMEEVCRMFGVSSTRISRWRQAFQQKGPGLFADQRDSMRQRKALGNDPGESPDDLKKLIGELTMQCKRPKADNKLVVRDEAVHEKDDTRFPSYIDALLRTGNNRFRRGIHTYGTATQSLRKKYINRSLATEAVPKSAA